MHIPRVHRFGDGDSSELSKKETLSKKDFKTAQITLKPSEYVDDLDMFENDPKELHKFVVRTKFLIRKSGEYIWMMSFLKKYHGMYCCGVHPNVKKWDGFQIEIHHSPLTIEDIIYIIINKRLKRGESLKMGMIAKEVMYDHYIGLVGLYPLCQVCHEYVHSDNSDMFIPLDVLYGEPEDFFDVYDKYIADSLKEKFKTLQEMTKGYSIVRREIPDNLRRHLVYVDSDSSGATISKSKLMDLLKD